MHVRWLLRFLLFPRTYKWYMSLFLPGKGQIAGDVTPSYSFMKASRVARVGAVLPNAKVIYLLRNPVTQIWSHAAMHFRMWYRQSLSEVSDKRLEKYIDRKKRSRISRYSANLETWTKSYPEERIYVGFFDQLMDEPAILFKEICRFLELDTPDSAVPKEVNHRQNELKYPDIPVHFAHRLAAQYQPEIETLHQRFSNKHTAAWLDSASRYLQSPG
jgi:hypothetical protein